MGEPREFCFGGFEADVVEDSDVHEHWCEDYADGVGAEDGPAEVWGEEVEGVDLGDPAGGGN